MLLLLQVDPYLGISDDLQVHAKPQADVRDYGSASDNQLASSLLLEMKNKAFESDKVIMDTLIQNISNATEVQNFIDKLMLLLSPSPLPTPLSLLTSFVSACASLVRGGLLGGTIVRTIHA